MYWGAPGPDWLMSPCAALRLWALRMQDSQLPESNEWESAGQNAGERDMKLEYKKMGSKKPTSRGQRIQPDRL